MKKHIWIKLLFRLLVIISIAFGIMIIVLTISIKNFQQVFTKDEIFLQLSSYSKQLEALENEALRLSAIVAGNTQAINAYRVAKESSEEQGVDVLITETESIENSIKGTVGEHLRIHYHTKDVRSFYRSWTNDRGDDLSSFRFTVREVVQSGKSIKGIEVGRSGLVIRGVSPVKNQLGDVLGSVECFFSFNDLLMSLKHSEKDEFAVFLNNETAAITDQKYGLDIEGAKLGEYVLVAQTSAAFSPGSLPVDFLNSSFKSVNFLEVADFVFASKEIRDYSGRQIGHLVYQYNISAANKITRSISNLLTYLIIGLFFSLVFLIYLFTKSLIANPIQKVVNAMNQIASKNLNVKINEERSDEIGQLYIASNKISDNFVQIISELRNIISHIIDASSQLSSVSAQLSDGASQQAATIEEVSASMQQILSIIISNAERAQQTNQKANMASKNLETSSTVFLNAIDTMKKVTDKVSIIAEIARETKILSLNASVEAARAGDYGRGFAVVAEEVQKLSEESKDASIEIGKIALESNQNSSKAAQDLLKIIPDIKQTASELENIVAASREQQAGAQTVNDSVQQLNAVANANSSTAEELSANAEELSAQTEQLNQLMKDFII